MYFNFFGNLVAGELDNKLVEKFRFRAHLTREDSQITPLHTHCLLHLDTHTRAPRERKKTPFAPSGASARAREHLYTVIILQVIPCRWGYQLPSQYQLLIGNQAARRWKSCAVYTQRTSRAAQHNIHNTRHTHIGILEREVSSTHRSIASQSRRAEKNCFKPHTHGNGIIYSCCSDVSVELRAQRWCVPMCVQNHKEHFSFKLSILFFSV